MNTQQIAQELAKKTEGNESEYVTFLQGLAQQLENTIDSDTAESLLKSAHKLEVERK